MNKKTKSLIAVYAILALMFILLYILIPFPKNASNIISFLFTLIAMALSLLAIMRSKNPDLKSMFYGFPVLKVLLIYPIVQLCFCILVCITSAFVVVPYWISLIVSFLILGISAIGVIATDNAKDIIQENEAEFERAIKPTKIFNLNISSIVDLCNCDVTRKELEKLAEEFRYSDPVSSDATAEIESVISEKLEDLKSSVTSCSEEDLKKKINELKIALSERNRICKATK